MAFKEYGSFDAVGLADLVRKKQVSAAELLDEAISRTAKVDPQINAVVVKHYDYAKQQIDKGLPDGPFTGVPFLLKDLDLLQGTVTTFGASVYRDNVADHTGTLAQRFLETGVAIFGKSSSPEFGLMPTTESRLFGPTRNPWNLGSLVRRIVRRCGRGSRRAHPADGACQRRRRLDPHSGFGLRRVRHEADPGAQSARARSRRRLGRLFLRPCRQHQRARQRGHDGRDPRTGDDEPLRRRRRRSGRSRRKSAAIPAACALPSPIVRPMAMPSIPK